MDKLSLPAMYSSEMEILQTALLWLEQGFSPLLATVVHTWGSAPRRPGAMMLIHPDGRFVGSVSGGCIEDELVQKQFKGEFEFNLPKSVKYGVSQQQAQSVGLPCGGMLTLILERLESKQALEPLLESVTLGQPMIRKLCLTTGKTSLFVSDAAKTFSFDGSNMLKTFGPQWQQLIIGAGELSKRTAQLALTLDYKVYVCDPRAEYAANWQLANTTLLSSNPVEALKTIRPSPRTAVLALAHTALLDDKVIAAALQSNAFYVGALGSRKHNQARRERLRRLGLDDTALDRFHGPVGLDIGSHTPAEIAIAIMAGIIQARNNTILPLPSELGL